MNNKLQKSQIKKEILINGQPSNDHILQLLNEGLLKSKDLETFTKDCHTSVELRRKYYSGIYPDKSEPLNRIPFKHYDYEHIKGQCCEEVIGYVSLPIGLASPIIVDNEEHLVPLATTEGCLLASTNRGAKATQAAGGITTVLYNDGMTRAPVVRFNSITRVLECMQWLESSLGFELMKTAFDGTSRFASLKKISTFPSGQYLHLRFCSSTGEAMGMNIMSKGTEESIRILNDYFPDMKLISISGNMCSDKKATAINWILGRGKSVMAECRLSHSIISSILKTDAISLQNLCMAKNFSGSAMAGCSSGGFNAHAANVIAAIFAATGQDIAQVVESSSCLTQFEAISNEDGTNDLLVTCTMPCIEVGTIGGGTKLYQQKACLDLLQLNEDNKCGHFARIICATVLCAELSLMAALQTNDLVKSHLLLNRASPLQDHIND